MAFRAAVADMNSPRVQEFCPRISVGLPAEPSMFSVLFLGGLPGKRRVPSESACSDFGFLHPGQSQRALQGDAFNPGYFKWKTPSRGDVARSLEPSSSDSGAAE